MTVTYIYHSGFLAELPHMSLLFDYYTGEIPPIREEVPLFIFASHSHGDHFNRKIFRLAEKVRSVYYILSSDIPESAVPEKLLGNTVFLEPDETRTITAEPAETRSGQQMTIRTLRSNDLGVAFIVEADGKKIYFAGDLNNWWWDGDDEDKQLEKAYRRELEKIQGETFDIAFIPLDPRIVGYEKGIEDFLHFASANVIFPMHFGRNHGIIEKMLGQNNPGLVNTKLVNIERPEQKFTDF